MINSNIAQEKIKAQVEAAVMARHGKKQGAEIKFQCPNESAHKHGDSSPSANYNPAKGVWICRACGESGNYWQLGILLEIIDSKPLPDGYKETRRWEIGDKATHKRLDHATEKKQVIWEHQGKNGLDGLRTSDLPLYAAELISDKNADILVSEGEKATDPLLALGFTAVGTVTGAGAIPSKESLKILAEHHGRVFLFSDNDEPGRAHMERIATTLLNMGKRAYLSAWPDVPEKGDAYDFIKASHTVEDVQAVLESALLYDGDTEANLSPLDDSFHDIANAKRLIAYCAGNFRYNYDRNLFYFYNGKKWIEDKGSLIMAAAKATARNIYKEAAETEDKNKQDAIAKHAKASQSISRIKAMIDFTKDVLAVEIQDLNADPYLLNVNNGTIKLKTGELQPHNPDDLITQFIPIDYIPDAKGARFETFLNEVFEANQDLIGYVQRALGYSLTGDQSEQVLFFNKGAGFNGKSTLYGIVGDILSDYAEEVDPLAFMVEKNAHAGPNESLANLYGKRFVTSVEVKAAMRLNVALVKRMTGGEMIRCERKFEHGFNFKPTHKLWILGNAEPRIDDNTNSIWYRIKYINFAVTFPEEKRDRKLREYIVKNEGPAVLAWMVAGCLDWLKNGLREPQSIKEAVSAYRDSQDILHDYIFENWIVGTAESAKVKDVYANYKTWAGENNYEPLGKIAFNRVLSEKGFSHKPGGKNEQYWHGFSLKTAQDSVKSVNSDTQNQESPKKILREIETSEKSGNKNNKNNTSNELPDCPNCGSCNWTFNPDGSLHCETCGEK